MTYLLEYHYADNDPVNKIDPLGLRPSDDDDVWDGYTSCFGPFPSGSPTTDEAGPATPVVAEPNFCGVDPGEPPAPPTTVVLSVE